MTSGPAPLDDMRACRDAHERLIVGIRGLSDGQVAEPSLLPGWSRGHVLTHLARNADSVVRRLDAAARGDTVEQYRGGRTGRREEIAAGAHRNAAELIEDVRRSAEDVDACFAGYPTDAWDRPTRTIEGAERPARTIAFSRWREVEVHHVDLSIGYGPGNWPDGLVERWLPSLTEGLSRRAVPNEIMAWLLGRGPAPELAPWG